MPRSGSAVASPSPARPCERPMLGRSQCGRLLRRGFKRSRKVNIQKKQGGYPPAHPVKEPKAPNHRSTYCPPRAGHTKLRVANFLSTVLKPVRRRTFHALAGSDSNDEDDQ